MELQLKELLEIQELMSQNTTDAWNEQLQHTARVVVLEPLDGVEYNGWADRFDAFIKKLQEPKESIAIKRFARKCSITGKGMNKGFVVGDEYAINEESADILAKQSGYNDYSSMLNEVSEEDENQDICYWTQWEDVDDDDYYDADGNNYVDGKLQ